MRGTERLKVIEKTTDPLFDALPLLPKAETILVRLLRVGALGLDEYFAHIFRHLDITEKHYHALCVLVSTRQGTLYPSELSEIIGTSRANITKVLSSLEAKGYVSRKNSNKDGRRNSILITTKGRQIVGRITEQMDTPVEAAFANLTSRERNQLDKLLRKMIVSFDDALHANDPIV
ncbi:MarR family winged helix-turn-helix transcriptional regulator [Halioxenophilus aromaticivorans]|uniref:HTH marR-type domain-containing protein n=1 Tax=Halioxenophilus aromaticivorans TaxID=1306992 RepID=A0AAV3U8G3_9ALTE